MDQFDNQKQPYLSEKVLEALEFASVAHRNQLRKGPGDVPYISHPSAVGLILARAGFDDEVIIAGILHDVIEDTEFTYDDINNRFGEKIAGLVQDVSMDDNLPWKERKESYLNHLEKASVSALAVSAADLLANRVDMKFALVQHQDHWVLNEWKNPQASIMYDRKRVEIISSRLEHKLVDELREMVEEVAALIEKLFNKHDG